MAIQKFLPILCILFILNVQAYAQDSPAVAPTSPEVENEKIYQNSEEYPRFYSEKCEREMDELLRRKCADAAMIEFISKYIIYPPIARSNGIKGVVVISFVVEKDGTISGLKILRDIGAGCGQVVLDAFDKLEDEGKICSWHGKGVPVRVMYNYPFRFRLS